MTQASRLALIAMVGLLVGCAGIPQAYDPAQLTAQQQAALSRDKSSSVACSTAAYLTGRVTTVFINVDMGQMDGVVVVGPDCTSTVTITRIY